MHEIISESRHSGRQDYVLDRIIKVGDARVRIQVRRDFYDFQSSASASLWDGTKWNTVTSLMGTEPDMVRGPSSHLFAGDRRAACEQWQDEIADRLLATVKAVIG